MTDPATQHDPGGKTRLALPPGVTGRASFSECGRYRRELWRYFGDVPNERTTEMPFALWIGMNCSTGDATHDDPTVRWEWIRTRALGLAAFCKANVLSYRATDPKALLAAPVDDPLNLPTIRGVAAQAALIVLTCGVLPKTLRHYSDEVIQALRSDGRKLHCIGVTKDEWPRHPLYQRTDVPIVEYEGRL